MTAKTPTDAYTEQVSAIIGDAPAGSYRPEKPVELFIANRRVPTSCAGLSAPEKVELERMWRGQDLETLLATGMSPVGEDDDPDEAYPLDLEIADVVTDTGELRYRIYGMNYGGMFLMRADRLECVAFASQHSVEYWRVDQRDLFWAMDRALRRGGHGFVQPVHFEWGNDARWADIATKTPGTVASEPYVRNQFADPAA
jgi:hypothetical protein